MKTILKINSLVAFMLAASFSAQSQQKPSQRSFTSVVNEIKQQRAMHDKMISQIKQATPSNTASQSGNFQIQSANVGNTAPLSPQNSQATNQQPINNKPQQLQPSAKIKKQ
jgi:hypothetical protein